LNTKLSSEIFRSTKKNPPSSMKYELIYVGFRSCIFVVYGSHPFLDYEG
jgi:hypothetical protein